MGGGRASHDDEAKSQSWSLRYTSKTREDAFWTFLFPKFPVANSVTALGTGGLLVYFMFVTLVGRSRDGLLSREQIIAQGVVYAFFLAAVVVHTVIHAMTAWGSHPVHKGHRFSTACLAALTAIVSTATNWSSYITEESGNCPTLYIYDDDSRIVYSEANCKRYFRGWVATFFTLAVLLQLPFHRLLVSTSVSFVAVCAIGVIFRSEVTAAHIQIGHTAAAAAFTLFIRYHRECEERCHFELHQVLEADVTQLRQRREELRVLCQTLLPRLLLDRVEKAAVDRVDSSPNAAIVCIAVRDFARQCTSGTPMAVVRLLDILRLRLWRLTEGRELQSVSCVQDQLVAVGNLLRPMEIATSVYRCCDVALRATSSDFLRADVSLHAAVHVGQVTGGFVGERWVRYEAVGEGITTCRSALLASDSGQVLVTDAAVHECRDSLVTRELGVAVGADAGIRDEGSPDAVLTVGSAGLHVLEALSDIAPADSSLVMLGAVESTTDRSSEGESLVPTTSNNSGSASEKVAALLLAQQHLATGEISALMDDDNDTGTSGGPYAMRHHWLLFGQFQNRELEEKFLDFRAIDSASHGARTLLAFTWLILFLFVVLMIFFEGPRAHIAAVMLTFGAMAGVGLSTFPASASPRTFLAHHGKWSLLSMLLPLWVAFSCAVARPSLVGNEFKIVLMVGTFVRSTCFREAKYQLVAKPVMLILSQLHILLPGARIRTEMILNYFLILWSVVIDRDVDRAERARFVLKAQLDGVLAALTEERSVREGLLRSTMPKPIFEALLQGNFGSDEMLAHCVSDSAVMLVTASPSREKRSDPLGSPTPSGDPSIQALRAASRQLVELERTLDEYSQLHLISAFADVAIIVGPVTVPWKVNRVSNSEQSVQAIRAAMAISQQGVRGALLEFDETLQVTRTRGAPSFNVFGPAVTRMMAVVGAIDRSALSGVVVTERVIRIVDLIGLGGAFTESPLGRMKIRGVGVIRLTRLEPK